MTQRPSMYSSIFSVYGRSVDMLFSHLLLFPLLA